MHSKEHTPNANSSYCQVKRTKSDLKFFLLIIFFCHECVFFSYNLAPPKKQKKKQEKLPHLYVLQSP